MLSSWHQLQQDYHSTLEYENVKHHFLIVLKPWKGGGGVPPLVARPCKRGYHTLIVVPVHVYDRNEIIQLCIDYKTHVYFNTRVGERGSVYDT